MPFGTTVDALNLFPVLGVKSWCHPNWRDLFINDIIIDHKSLNYRSLYWIFTYFMMSPKVLIFFLVVLGWSTRGDFASRGTFGGGRMSPCSRTETSNLNPQTLMPVVYMCHCCPNDLKIFEGQPINQPPLKTRPKHPNQNILGPIWGVLGGIDMGFLGPQTVTVVNEYLQYKAPPILKMSIFMEKGHCYWEGGQKTWKKTFFHKYINLPSCLNSYETV